MPLDDNDQFADDIIDAIKCATDPLLKRIQDLELKSSTPPDISSIVDRAVERAVAAIPKPENGKDATVDIDALKMELRAIIVDEVAKIPKAADGASVTVDDVRPVIVDEVSAAISSGISQINEANEKAKSHLAEKLESAIAALPKPVDGKSVSVEDVMPELLAAAQDAVDKIPRPIDGKSVTVDDVVPVLDRLVESLHARWELSFERRAAEKFDKVVERMPLPKDGKDGLGFEDLSVDFDGERLVTLNFARGDTKKTFPLILPVVIYRGVFDESSAYKHLDSVTFDGSVWIAQKDAPVGKPGPSADWRLSVKRGRNGKNGENGKDFTPRGPVKLP